MLMSEKSTVQAPRWIRTVGTVAAVCLLPLGLVYCGFADESMPTALEDAAGLTTLSEESAGEQPTKVVFTYDMTGNGLAFTFAPRRGALKVVPHADGVLPTCLWIAEPGSEERRHELLPVCLHSWHEWHGRFKRIRAEQGRYTTVTHTIHVSPEVATKWVWRLQESLLANR